MWGAVSTVSGISCTSSRTRALSLAEVAVSLAVFSLLLVAIVLIGQVGKQARTQEDAQQRNYRAALLALQHIKQELAHARVDDIRTARLRYRQPQVDEGGLPRFGPTGELFWGPSTLLRTISGRLVRDRAGEPRRELASLGPHGSVTFEQPTETLTSVIVRVHTQFGDEPSPADVSVSLRLRIDNR